MPVLRLTDEIAGDDFRVGTGIGDNRNLGRSGKNIDADLAEQRALGLGDEFIPGSDNDVGRLVR